MSGIVGHSMDALLGLKAADQRRLPLAGLARKHLASYVAGAYLGSDIQIMPEAVYENDGREVGFGTVPLDKGALARGPVRPFRLTTPEGSLSPRQIHERFYGRAHLVFGWTQADAALRVPWDHLPDYFAAVMDDALDLFGPGQRPLAYALGWVVHVVSDSLIKGMQPGIDLNLVDGRYTPRNRPVQDLYTFHEIGIREFHLNWPALFADMAQTPVEPLQFHYMRCAARRGALGRLFPDGWQPAQEPTLGVILAENRRYVIHHAQDVLADMELHDTPQGKECRDSLRETVGLNYAEMLMAAEKAGFRHALWQMGEQIAAMFEQITHRCPRLASLPADDGPSWEQIAKQWNP